MTNEAQLKRWISYISFSFVTVANCIGLIASRGTPSMFATGVFMAVNTAAFPVFCLWLKKYDIYLKYVLLLFMMTLFPFILWTSPKTQQATLYVFIIPSFYAISIKRKRNLILPVVNGLLIAAIIYVKVNVIYAIVFLTIFIFSLIIQSMLSITLFSNFAELEDAYSLIADIARKDSLTGIYNRFGLQNVLRGKEQDSCHAIMIDIDFFKQINDTHGHEAGDRVLSMIGAVLRKFSGPDFIVSRWGGEEFLLYSFKDYAGTMDTLRNIYGEVANTVCVGTDHVHISAGVSGRGFISEDLIADADKKLYHAKKTGRNRITSRI